MRVRARRRSCRSRTPPTAAPLTIATACPTAATSSDANPSNRYGDSAAHPAKASSLGTRPGPYRTAATSAADST
ncbi:hypothetical protein GEV43_05535 [Actinomadura sp. J1-007]|nr:hypothetical protein [Actinomadura sp. J1-007]MWK33554.1 hypothetical protein [Actinomadura sp. J1-007]